MKNIKKNLGIITSLGALLPLLKFTIKPLGFDTKYFTLGLINLGLKATILAFIIIALSLYSFYLSDNLQKKFSIVFVTLNMILVITLSLLLKTEVKKILSQNFALKLLNVTYSYSWGWLVLFLGTLSSFIVVLFEFKKFLSNKNEIPKIETENNKIEL
ncbi:hypothetical protein KX935_00805 [Streptobacillus moniliformis]|nr:hypothetical protein KX935_00805 [Streptobacillus moniliformis]